MFYYHKGLTRAARRTVATAITIAGRQGCTAVDTGHLLLAMLQTDRGPAGRFLAGKNITEPAVRRQLAEEYPLAAVPFDDYVEKSDVIEQFEQPVTVTPARIRRMESRSIHTASGIEVKIPTEILSSESEVEFLHDPDGSVSLLIKNVIL